MKTEQTQDRLLDVDEVAELLNCSARNVWKLLATGRMGPHEVRIGRLVRFRSSEIDEWLRAGAPGREEWDATHRGSA